LIQRKTETDDRKGTKKIQKQANSMHIVINNTEHSELLGVRTGLKTYSEKPREEKPKEVVPRRERKEEAVETAEPKPEGEEQVEEKRE